MGLGDRAQPVRSCQRGGRAEPIPVAGLADALDRVHDQSLGRVAFKRGADTLASIPEPQAAAGSEEVAMAEKSELFEFMGRDSFGAYQKRWGANIVPAALTRIIVPLTIPFRQGQGFAG